MARQLVSIMILVVQEEHHPAEADPRTVLNRGGRAIRNVNVPSGSDRNKIADVMEIVREIGS